MNPSFEEDGNIGLLWLNDSTGWLDNVSSPFGGDVHVGNYHTDGNHGARIFSESTGTFLTGDNAYLKQSINLTGITSILFDAQLYSPVGPWQSFLEADFYVDSVKKWSKNSLGTYANQSIDVTGMTGMHSIEFRLLANAAGSNGNSSWYQFDNVRAVPEPSVFALLATSVIGLIFAAKWKWKRN